MANKIDRLRIREELEVNGRRTSKRGVGSCLQRAGLEDRRGAKNG